MTAIIWITAWKLIRLLPEKSAYKLFNLLAIILFKLKPSGIKMLRNNLSKVTDKSGDELDQLVLAATKSYSRYWCDTFRSSDWQKTEIIQRVTTSNGGLLIDALNARQSVVVALPHSGNWDLAGAYYCALGYKLTTVAERLKPERVFQAFLQHREKFGMEVLPLESRVIATLSKRLKDGGFIALVADRDLSDSGIEINFFGSRAKFPKGPALLSKSTNSLLLTAVVSYLPSGINISFEKIDTAGEVAEITQRIANSFEKGIKVKPEDWHMLQRIWFDNDL